MKNPQQESLFAFEVQQPSENTGLRIRPTVAHLSPAQKKFNLLLEQIAAARATVLMWTTETERLRERHMLEVIAHAKPMQALQLALALQVEAILFSPPPRVKMAVRRRRALTEYILHLARTLLHAEPDNQEFQALHDRHSEDDFASIRAEEHAIDMEIAEDMLSNLYGEDVVDKSGAADFEELIQRTHERMEQQQQSAPVRKRSKREQASDARRKAETDALSQSLREIYRKLASSLHPDREPDLVLRGKKTELMQRINIAYQNKDLLALLTLQMEVEQISSASLGEVPEARLAQYNQILREQLDTLKAQQQTLVQTLFDVLEPSTSQRVPVAQDFDRAIDEQKRQMQRAKQSLEHSLEALKDPARQARGIDEIVSAIAEQEKLERMQAKEDARMARYFRF